MNHKASEIWVGLFVLAGLVVICGMVLHFGKFRERFYKMYSFDVRFANVGQIARGAPVICSGVVVGKVKDITLEREGAVRLTLAAWEGISLRRDAHFTIKQAGLLGDLQVVVIPVSDSAPQLQNGDVVEGINPTDISDTLEQAAQVVIKIKSAADNIESATRKLDKQVLNDQTLADLSQAISNLNVVSVNTDHLVSDTRDLVGKTSAGIDSTLANLTQFSTNLSQAAGKTLDIVKTNEEDVRAAVQNLKSSSEHLNTMLAQVESGHGTIGKLLVDESFHQELKRLITNLRRFGILKYHDEPLPAEPPHKPGAASPSSRSKS